MQARDSIPWATRESTPVERILDLSFGTSSTKQESGFAHVYVDLERHIRRETRPLDACDGSSRKVICGRCADLDSGEVTLIPGSKYCPHCGSRIRWS